MLQINTKLTIMQKYLITLMYFISENIYLLSLSILKFYYISTYEKNNILIIMSYITGFIQLFIVISRIITIIYNYFNDNDLTKNINHIIFIFLILGFINFIIISSLSINEINNLYNDKLYKLRLIDNISIIFFLLIRNLIMILYEYDFI